MPPLRTATLAKVAKVERTHEENQERAYIAASRRSDRSLEARVESARRASEIHKARTGRGLKVTEEDVRNEEMYEEEDEDLPQQYRRLQAHMKGHASEFSKKLQSYMDAQYASRNGLMMANPDAYGQQFFGQPQFANPMMAHQPQIPQPFGYPTHPQSSYPQARQAPYPQRGQQQNGGVQYQPNMSTPQPLVYNGAPIPTGSVPPASVSPGDTQTSILGSRRPSFAPGSFAQMNQTQPQNTPYQEYGPGGSSHPFSATLPTNVQDLQQVALSMNFNDPVNQQFMTGYDGSSGFGSNPSQLKQETYLSQGMHSTLGRSDSTYQQETQQEAHKEYLDNSDTLNPSQDVVDGDLYRLSDENYEADLNFENFLEEENFNDNFFDIPTSSQ